MGSVSKRLLLVEDEAIIAMREKMELERLSYSVDRATSGEEAVRIARGGNSAFDAILMDIDLGSGMDGTEAAEAILKSSDIPIVFLSSHTEPDIVMKTEGITSYGYVVKNSGIVVLDASIKMALKLFNEKLERSRAERQVLQLKNLYAALSQINQAIVRIGSTEELAGEVCRVAVDFGLLKFAWVGRHEPRTREISPLGYSGEPESIAREIRHSSDEAAEHPCLCGKAVRDGRAQVLNDLSSGTGSFGLLPEMAKAGIEAAAIFPIRVGGAVWGVFGLYAGESGAFQEREIALLDEAAMDIGYAIENIEREARRRQADKFRLLSTSVLTILNRHMSLGETSASILRLIKEEMGLDAVGIRLKDRDDFPYFCEEGFGEDFIRAENSLIPYGDDGSVCRDEAGGISLECTCGMVICEKCGPPSDNVTAGGSLWTNDSLATAEGMRGKDPRLKPRDRCVHDGYLSVALIPIRADNRVIGLLHLNDRRRDRFTAEAIAFFEELTASFGIVVERKRWERRLLESEARFRLALSHAPVSVAAQDLDLRYTWAYNQRTREPAEIIGKTDFDLFAEEAERLVPLKRRALETGQAASEKLWITSNGQRLYLDLYVEPLKGERGDIEGLGSVTLNLTERKQAEDEILRQLAEKDLVLKEAHHRMKNNIASIEGLLSIAADSSGSEEAKAVLGETIAQVRSVRVLYEKLLSGDDYHALSSRDYIESLVESLAEVFPEHPGVAMELKIADFPVGSRTMLIVGIIINELITNIFKHAFEGRSERRVWIELDRAGANVRLVIKDNGVGIGKGSAAEGASGFGLSLVEMLARQLKGSFSMTSCDGTKSVLEFALED